LQQDDESYGVDIPFGEQATRQVTPAVAYAAAAAGTAAALDVPEERPVARRPAVRELPFPPWLLRTPATSAAARRRYDRTKRALDVAVAATALVLSSPLWLVCALAIKLDSPGPIIFAQRRSGRGGRRFVMYKFRTMVADAEARRGELAQLNERQWPDFKIRHDPRITRIGALLRRASLDELPQLWNVLRGDMSLVGPRPTSFAIDHFLEWRRRRFDVPPGLTGIWQIYGRDEKRFDERCLLDNHYVEHRSMRLDLYLLLRTIPVLLLRPSGS
jgi:lipopolysaccharide/colanic/teichoic acid biosynthesis glycosyltransferase